jgi:hypothetical protein
VNGKIAERLAQVGDHVRADQVIARLEPQEQQINVDTARAALNCAEALLAQAKVNFERPLSGSVTTGPRDRVGSTVGRPLLRRLFSEADRRLSARASHAPGVYEWLGWVDFCLSAYGRQCMAADLVDMRAFNQLGRPHMHRGDLHLYGHSHGTLPGTAASTDVGVDCFGFRPVTLDEIRVRQTENAAA